MGQLYPVSGDSFDWAYTVLNVTDSYCFELRPDGDSWKIGFELPEEEILPTAEENVDGLLALVANIKHEVEEGDGEDEDGEDNDGEDNDGEDNDGEDNDGEDEDGEDNDGEDNDGENE